MLLAAIVACHCTVGGMSLRKHDLIVRFLRGAQRLNPPRFLLIPSWDLTLVLQALQRYLFEPLQSVELSPLSIKMALLIVLTFIKRVGDLQVFSVSELCLELVSAYSTSETQPEYVPPLRDQVVNLQGIPPDEGDPTLSLLCPVHDLRIYLDQRQSFR